MLLDLSGGALSFGQVFLDALARGDATVITGNPAKLWIAVLSIGYDLIFVAQHYWLSKDEDAGGAPAGGAPKPAPVAVAAAPGAVQDRGIGPRDAPRPRAGVRAFAGRAARRAGGSKAQP